MNSAWRIMHNTSFNISNIRYTIESKSMIAYDVDYRLSALYIDM